MTENILVHGDCREVKKYMDRCFPGRSIDCMVIDPPFGVSLKLQTATTPQQQALNLPIENDQDFDTASSIFLAMAEETFPLLSADSDIYIFSSWQVLGEWDLLLKEHLPQYGLRLSCIGVWDKGYPGQGNLNGSWGIGFEYIFFFKKGQRVLNRNRRRNLILAVDKEPRWANIHPAQKPTALMEALIEASSNPGDLVVDPFSGSGAVSIAAQRCGRDSLAFETDERFIAPSRARLAQVGLGV